MKYKGIRMQYIGAVIALDSYNNRFVKSIFISHGESTVLSFGEKVFYSENNLRFSAPEDDKLYLDKTGQDHSGTPVYVLWSQIRRMLDKYHKEEINQYNLKVNNGMQKM